MMHLLVESGPHLRHPQMQLPARLFEKTFAIFSSPIDNLRSKVFYLACQCLMSEKKKSTAGCRDIRKYSLDQDLSPTLRRHCFYSRSCLLFSVENP